MNMWDVNTNATFIVCTKDRPQQLKRCLLSIVPQLHVNDELIVVDNSPTSNSKQIAESVHARWISELGPGVSWARNRGFREAQYEIVIYIDDDCIADSYWADELRVQFNDSTIGVVTGSILASRPDLAVPYLIDTNYSYNRGWKSMRFVGSTGTSWSPYDIWRVGVGATMAWRKSLLVLINGFDPALGTGTPAGSSEDIDAFRRALLTGTTICYQPRALVWHDHPKDINGLRRLLIRYAIASGAHAMKMAIEEHRIKGLAFLFRDWRLQVALGVQLLIALPTTQNVRLPVTALFAQPAASILGMYRFMKYKRAMRIGENIRSAPLLGRESNSKVPLLQSNVIMDEIELTDKFTDYYAASTTRLLIRISGHPVTVVEISEGRYLSQLLDIRLIE